MLDIDPPTLPYDKVNGDRYGVTPIEVPDMVPLPPVSATRRVTFDFLKTAIWFTILPVNRVMNMVIPPKHNPDYEIRLPQYYWLPLIGGIVVALTMVFSYGLYRLDISPVFAAMAGGFIYHLMYGHIHLEGLSDTVDALHAYPRKDPMKVLTEPYTGALGARYSGTANNLCALALATLCYKFNETGALIIPVAAIAVVVAARAIPLYTILTGVLDKFPGGVQALGVAALTPQIRRIMNYIFLASLIVPVVLAAFLDYTQALAVFLSAQVAFIAGVYLVRRVVRYLNVIYGDIYGAAITLGEIVGLTVASILMSQFV